MIGPIYYDERQSVAGIDSFSPSAGKPARFMELLGFHYRSDVLTKVAPVTPVTIGDLYLVHDKAYVDGVFDGTTLNGFENNDRRVAEACLWTVGSLVCAVERAATEELPVLSPTSGFHHAYHSFGGGFCTFNGLAVAAAKYLAKHPGHKVGILDCDFHYGDGTADILKKLPDLAANVRHHTSGLHFKGDGDDPLEFFAWLDDAINDLNDFDCDVVIYQAGADMHINDPLGGLLTDAGLEARDRAVFCGIQAGIAWNLAGGYQKGKTTNKHDDPVLRIHLNTLGEANASSTVRLNRKDPS